MGLDQEHAYAWRRTREGGWAVAQSPILITTITLKRLEKRGYMAMLTYYANVAPHFNEPLYTRTVHRVVGEAHPVSFAGWAVYPIIQNMPAFICLAPSCSDAPGFLFKVLIKPKQ